MSAGRPHPTPSLPAAGSTVRIRGKRGVWMVRGSGKDGSMTVTGGPAGQWRSVMPDRVVPIRVRRNATSRLSRLAPAEMPLGLRA
jgi:hypothetical protein